MLSVQSSVSNARAQRQAGLSQKAKTGLIVAGSTVFSSAAYLLGTRWPTIGGMLEFGILGGGIPLALKGISLGVKGYIESKKYRFNLERVIGSGAMGTVVRVYDRLEEKTRALKFPLGEMLINPDYSDAMTRFYFEAEVCERLSHPNILKGHGLLWVPTKVFNRFTGEKLDPGRVPAVPAIIMDYLEGMTLRDKISQIQRDLYHEGLSISYGCGIALQLTEVLIYLRENKLIHRDLKPDNIMMCPLHEMLDTSIPQDVRVTIASLGERAVVFDFGVARLEGPEGGFGTRTGMGIGSPYYMSDEQWKGKAQKESDVYSVGAILWECITGKPPRGYINEGETALDYSTRAAQPVPAIEPFLPIDVPLADKEILQKIFNNTLHPDPRMRYQNLGLLKEDLGSLSFVGRAQQTRIGQFPTLVRQEEEE